MSDSYRNINWFQTRIYQIIVILDMVNAERNVSLAGREYVFAWKMDSVMAYIKNHMDNMYSDIDTVSRYMIVNVNCFTVRLIQQLRMLQTCRTFHRFTQD